MESVFFFCLVALLVPHDGERSRGGTHQSTRENQYLSRIPILLLQSAVITIIYLTKRKMARSHKTVDQITASFLFRQPSMPRVFLFFSDHFLSPCPKFSLSIYLCMFSAASDRFPPFVSYALLYLPCPRHFFFFASSFSSFSKTICFPFAVGMWERKSRPYDTIDDTLHDWTALSLLFIIIRDVEERDTQGVVVVSLSL